MNKLNKLFNETLSQCVGTPEIADSFSDGLKSSIKKMGIATFVGFLALGSAGMAHADNTSNALIGLNGVGAILVDGARPAGLPPECANVQGVNGWKVAGAGTAAAYGFSNVGGGRGRKAAEILGTVVVGAAVLGQEEQRIENECARIMAANRQNNQNYQNNQGGSYQYQENNPNNAYQYGRPMQNNNYQNNGNYQNTNYDTPRYNQPNLPTEPIFYQATDAQGRSFFVTYSTSPGLQALTGNRQGGDAIGSSPTIQRAVDGSLNALNNDYKKLDQASQNYLNLVNGRNSVEDRYNMNNISGNSAVKNSANYHQKIQQALREVDATYNQYVKDRGLTLVILDNAAGVDNKDLSQYREAAALFVPPQSAKVTYNSAYQQELPNRYPKGLNK